MKQYSRKSKAMALLFGPKMTQLEIDRFWSQIRK